MDNNELVILAAPRGVPATAAQKSTTTSTPTKCNLALEEVEDENNDDDIPKIVANNNTNDSDNNNDNETKKIKATKNKDFETSEILIKDENERKEDSDSVPEIVKNKIKEIENNNLILSSTSTSASAAAASVNANASATNNTCPFANHHYHYIDYPAAYYQRKHQRNAAAAAATTATTAVAMSQNINSNAYHYCACACSCSCESHMQILKHQQQHHQQLQQQHIAADVVVHQQNHEAATTTINTEHDFRTRSEQSLNNSHSYQVLNVLPEKKKISNSCRSKLNLNSTAANNTCNVECNCSAVGPQTQPQQQQQQKQRFNKKQRNTINNIDGSTTLITESMFATADEITVSESDNNGTMTKRKNMRESRVHKKINSWYEKNYNCNHIEIYSDGDGDEVDLNPQSDIILMDDQTSTTANILDQRPPLPPRPQPPPSPQNPNRSNNAHRPGSHSVKKYVIWCLICGGFSCLLGALFLGVYFLLHSYTITVGNFETVPTFVPATLLILTGVCIMSLARRRNRYSYLIKLSGACGLISALTCALVTVTTTVLHMSRLQALRECEYAQKTRTCTCYSDMIESQVDRVDKEGVRLVFDSLSDCGVVHGSLYSCLRAIFGLSVAGVLTSVFSCMLVYQLLSHERKKMYWEQLELRCRSLYSTHQNQHPTHHQHQQHPSQAGSLPPHTMANTIAASINARNNAVCRCCEQCHAHRQLQLQAAATYPWVDDVAEPRFWAGQPPGNFYSPNPCVGTGGVGVGSDDSNLHAHVNGNNRNNRLTTGWSWPRMPWQRNTNGSSNNRFRQVPSSPDSQYGFSSANASLNMAQNVNTPMSSATVIEDDAAAIAAATASQRAAAAAVQVFNMNANSNLPYGVWGPPPPYSDPNSPARRGFYQYMQAPSICTGSNRIVADNANAALMVGSVRDEALLQHRPLSAGALNTLTATDSNAPPNTVHCVSQRAFEQLTQLCGVGQIENVVYKTKDQNGAVTTLSSDYCSVGVGVGIGIGNSCTDDDSDMEYSADRRGERFMNTLPTRKIKKRVIDGSGSIAKCNAIQNTRQKQQQHLQQQLPAAAHRINVQRIFPGSSNSTSENDADNNGNPRLPLSNTIINNANNNNNNDIRETLQSSKHRIHQKVINTDHVGSGGNSGGGDGVGCGGGIENSAFHNNSGECDSLANGACGNNAIVVVETVNCDVVGGVQPYEDTTESEIYFADVSSCCNMSMKNGNCYEDSNRKAMTQQITHDHNQSQRTTVQKRIQTPHHLPHNHKQQNSNCSQSSNASCCRDSREEQRENSQQQRNTRHNNHHHNQQTQHQQQELKQQVECYNNNKKKQQNCATNRNTQNEALNNRLDNNKIDNAMEKYNSMQSMCSIETVETDLSPITPSSNNNNINNNSNCSASILNTNNLTNFIHAAFPEAQRRFKTASKTISTAQGTTTTANIIQQDPHYEIINDGGITTSSMSPQPQFRHNHNHSQQRQSNLNTTNVDCMQGHGSLGRRRTFARNTESTSSTSTKAHINHQRHQADVGGSNNGGINGGGHRHRQRL